MSSPWQGLLANFALVALIVSIWTHAEILLNRRFQHAIPVILGIVFGLGAIALMMLPIRLEGGILIDLRIVPVVLSGVFGGPIASLITTLLTIFCRWQLGGHGMVAGILNVTVGGIVGSVAWRLVKGRLPTVGDILKLSLLTAVSGLPSMFMLPKAIVHDALLTVALPQIGAIFGSMLIAGMAISNERRRNADASSNYIYHTIIDALPDSLNVKDLQGRFIAVNPATARLMRASSKEDLIGKTDFDFYPEATARIFREEEYMALATGGSSTIEQCLTHHNGEKRWLSTLKTPFYDRRGVLMGLITHNRDITKSKQQEAELLALNTRLERLASTDGLTGLANRRAFDEALEACVGAAEKSGIPASVLLIDVDRFKAFNDTYGHQAGDECLKRIAKLMQAMCIGDQEIAARYGGEEMAVILPNTPIAAARAAAEALRLGVYSLDISHTASELRRVTVSIGVAQTGHCAHDPADLLRAADNALYQAKATGRDRVRTADVAPPLARVNE